MRPGAARSSAALRRFRPIPTGAIICCSTSISTATTAQESARAIRPDGPRWWRILSMSGVVDRLVFRALFLRPIVVHVAFETAPLGAAALVAAPACIDRGKQHIRSFVAQRRLGVAFGTRNHLVRIVIEPRALHPSRGNRRVGNSARR